MVIYLRAGLDPGGSKVGVGEPLYRLRSQGEGEPGRFGGFFISNMTVLPLCLIHVR